MSAAYLTLAKNLADLFLVLAAAGKMLLILSPALVLWAVCVAAIKSVSPDRITSRAQERS